MKLDWTGSVEIEAPVERVYAYLADFPRHVEWAQTLERLELKRPGDTTGVGAVYTTYEKQEMQANRPPLGPLPDKKKPDMTEAVITELVPSRRIAWRARPLAMAMGIHAALAFDLTRLDADRTKLTQTIDMHIPWLPMQAFSRLQFKKSPEALKRMMDAQWQASLANIKTILEQEHAPLAPSAA